ncbi:MAG: type 4a pilus biogenesis protein PilO [Gammaproteobacteria bacterium]|uniref:type 4a pilus biogenesis protein PilO n=1 Tax=Pseudomaricurvus alcaniphilus TaxID=1166482 RepID=UPI00140B1EAE|nr:type 4a pilus biogenesis protein PilO [Pseudomaricurvus alcaniphilus]MBR9909829.1 type 4a pilus biogenesis protein PilO [Gammaproteobacteria bacterium]NHN38555.1 type 4a pilus biogenesis protein PilO [Pseudomaricurvus alcaniphilus]
MALQDVIDQINSFDINDIDWTRMGVWPVAGKLVLCTLLVTVLVAGGYFFFIKDLNIQLARVTAQEQDLRSTFKTKAFQAANLEAYREQMKEIEESFGALLAQLPSDTEVPGLLEDIDEKGSESGLVISSIELKPEVKREFYVELPISIKVSGPYHDFGTFVSGVAGMPRIVTLHDYDIKAAKTGGLLDMTILAKTYRYNSKEQ